MKIFKFTLPAILGLVAQTSIAQQILFMNGHTHNGGLCVVYAEVQPDLFAPNETSIHMRFCRTGRVTDLAVPNSSLSKSGRGRVGFVDYAYNEPQPSRQRDFFSPSAVPPQSQLLSMLATAANDPNVTYLGFGGSFIDTSHSVQIELQPNNQQSVIQRLSSGRGITQLQLTPGNGAATQTCLAVQHRGISHVENANPHRLTGEQLLNLCRSAAVWTRDEGLVKVENFAFHRDLLACLTSRPTGRDVIRSCDKPY